DFFFLPSLPLLEEAPIISLSCCSKYLATVQPLFNSPIRFFFSTRTLSKKVWQNGEEPEISLMGAVLTPGVVISNKTKLMPSRLGACGSVRTRQKIQSA